MLTEKPLDKITVTDLTEHCGVNRMTFYHFKDIYDQLGGPAWKRRPRWPGENL